MRFIPDMEFHAIRYPTTQRDRRKQYGQDAKILAVEHNVEN
ncbi:MAG TPA: hypothetical protein VJT50_01335 [Pyrinomonadaceae bacterium]|nr:hypothetical protein [Pyrinomonadaceae bacterium]